jgi:hypothetical protein
MMKLALTETFVEVEYTRDKRADLPDGGWSCTAVPPDGIGWFLWDTTPDRKSGWLRVWKRDRGISICTDGGSA